MKQWETVINFGCGRNKIDGAINCDINSKLKPDKQFDFNERFPFKDNFADRIVAKHIIEHLDSLKHFVEECWRVSKPNAVWEIWSPHFSDLEAIANPFHKQIYGLVTFWNFDIRNKYNDYETHAKVEMLQSHITLKFFHFFEGFINRHGSLYEKILCHYLPADEFYVKLKVIKFEN